MRVYEWTDDMRDVSDVGGAYEHACRKMVIAGAQWMGHFPDPRKATKPGRSDVAEVMVSAVDGTPSGDTVNNCLEHAMFVHTHGWDEYREAMKK